MANKKKTTSPRHVAAPRAGRLPWPWLAVGLGALLLAFGGLWMWTNASPAASPAVAAGPEITVAEAHARYQAGADFFLDVRTPEEWAETHLANSTLIPLDKLPQRINELPRDQPIVVVCRSGRRSLEAQGILQHAGFEQAVSMDGGVNDWRAAGYPVVSGP